MGAQEAAGAQLIQPQGNYNVVRHPKSHTCTSHTTSFAGLPGCYSANTSHLLKRAVKKSNKLGAGSLTALSVIEAQAGDVSEPLAATAAQTWRLPTPPIQQQQRHNRHQDSKACLCTQEECFWSYQQSQPQSITRRQQDPNV